MPTWSTCVGNFVRGDRIERVHLSLGYFLFKPLLKDCFVRKHLYVYTSELRGLSSWRQDEVILHSFAFNDISVQSHSLAGHAVHPCRLDRCAVSVKLCVPRGVATDVVMPPAFRRIVEMWCV